MHDPAMKCDSKSCRIQAEENWANLQEFEKQQKTIEYRASDWPDACGGLSLDDCDLTSSCAKGIGEEIDGIFPPSCDDEICGTLEKMEHSAKVTEQFIWMLVLAEFLILIIWSSDVLVEEEPANPYYDAEGILFQHGLARNMDKSYQVPLYHNVPQ
ncbi:unnamed protein product [Oikopleura dioica]|uniref:Uncharacterized protein n=1 Tax=Oikopleura dioica TaxID=34765 RepID=E4X605_OIKDI|nr:unnamed protein product [Oikopleura dioica]CBY30684.1 unnamed protein product [Oikopleura dioica]